jgi:hypothetical protein
MQLPQDFKEFLRLLNSKKIDYLLIGGYAVGYHGYPRATVDMDIWISIDENNVSKIIKVINEFGFNDPALSSEIFINQKKVVRMGVPPIRLEVLSEIDGINFEDCFSKKIIDKIDGVSVNIIDLESLKINKKASGRLKDLSDLEYLP